MRSLLAAGLLALLLFASPAAADDPRFHRTTPRGSFGRAGPSLLVGVPAGRAWGIESELRAVPSERSTVHATVEVDDPAVREAFIRVAWYASATGRPRQFALADAKLVRAGETATLEVVLDPPPGAVAYRLRVLARLGARDAVSAADAIRVSLAPARARPSYPASRLLP
jgi:hypothetical protein